MIMPMKRTMKLWVLVFVLAIVIPQTGEAYTATKQTSVRLSDNVLMFLLTYEFGHDSFSYKMPVVAKRNTSSPDVMSYDILKDGKLRTDIGQSVGLVLSNAKIEGGKYVVPQGEAKEFTLVTFLTLPADRSASSTDYALAVSNLPFELGKNGTYTKNHLNESELTNYRTPVIGTDQKVGITLRPKN